MTFTFSGFVALTTAHEYLDSFQLQQADWLIYYLINNKQTSRKLPVYIPSAPFSALGNSSSSCVRRPWCLCLSFFCCLSSSSLELPFRAAGNRVPLPASLTLPHQATTTYTFCSIKVSCSLLDPIPLISPLTDWIGFHYVAQNDFDLTIPLS